MASYVQFEQFYLKQGCRVNLYQMTTERDKCGLGSFLPMSCRGRAEAFARRLHSRLTSLGSQDGTNGADESSWLAAHETTSLSLSQPRHTTTATTESDLLFGLEPLESPGSPEDELDPTNELEKLLNKDNLKVSHNNEDCHCLGQKKDSKNRLNKQTNSNDNSDSDGSFYDVENEEEKINLNGLLVNGINHTLNGSIESNETDSTISQDLLTNHSEDNYESTSALSDENSTLSLKDDDEFSSMEYINGFAQSEGPSKCDEVTQTSPEDEKLKTVPGDNAIAKETYTNSFSVENGMTVECPHIVVETAHPLLEIESPRTSKINSALKVEDDDDDTEIERIPRVRRCSSLKTGKTPPGTPGRKKIVRFADVLGLDLADVRTFMDEIPKVPTSAYEDLKDVDLGESDSDCSSIISSVSSLNKFHGIKVDKVLVPLFQQPGGQPDFLDKVRERSVCLENALVQDPLALAISGTVRVRNLDFHKSVHIRYSLNSWKTFADVQATYVENTCDGFSDRFSFLMYAHTLTVGQRLEFAVRFQCKGCQYWDNNKGANYCFQCLPATNSAPFYIPITGTDDGFGASFYY